MISLHSFFCTLRASCLVNLVGRIFKGILDFTNMSLQDLFSGIHVSSVSFLYLTESNAKNSQFHSNQKLMGTLICSFEKVSGVTQPSMIPRSLKVLEHCVDLLNSQCPVRESKFGTCTVMGKCSFKLPALPFI